MAFAVAAVVMVLALWRAARTPAGFALGVAALFLVFFVLNKQAFANYYFFVIGALCVAVAATERPPAARPLPKPWVTGRRGKRPESGRESDQDTARVHELPRQREGEVE